MTADRLVSPDLVERYRRLLRWYPPAHRAAHGDEMLGVLMESAEPGRRRPSPRDSLDLVRGGLLIRARRLRSDADALAVLSLVAPLVLLIGAAIGVHEVAWFLAAGQPIPPWQAFPEAPAYAVWPVLVLLAYLGFRRTAATGAWLATVALAYLLHEDFGGHYLAAPDKGGWVGLAALGAAALTVSAGPRRGLELLGTRRLLAVAAAVGLVLAGGVALVRYPAVYWTALPVLAVVVVLACRPAGWTPRWAATLVLSVLAVTALLERASQLPPDVVHSALLAAPFAAVLAVLLGGSPYRAPAPVTT